MLARVGNTTAATARLREALPDAIVTLSPSTNADDPDGEYAFGAYACYKLSGLGLTDNYVYGGRRFPYTTDNTINPLKWSDVATA